MTQKLFSCVSIYLIIGIGILNLPFDLKLAAIAQSQTPAALIAPTPGLAPFDKPESYSPDTLWEKINGQAEFYLPAGFERLKSQLFVDKVFTMAFQLGQDEVIAYISKRKSPAEAAKLANGLYAYYKDFGAKDMQMHASIKGARMIEIMGTFEIIFSIDNYCAGVHEAPAQAQAERLAQLLVKSLQTIISNRHQHAIHFKHTILKTGGLS